MAKLQPTEFLQFVTEVKAKIQQARLTALKAVNHQLIDLNWTIGQLIVERQAKHGWGKSVVEKLSKELQKAFPNTKGYSVQNLWYMRQFYLEYYQSAILQPMVGEISWTKNIIIMSKCKDDLQREFYLKMTKKYGWTKAVLQHQIGNQSYEKYLLNQTSFDQTLPDYLKGQAKLALKDEYKPNNTNLTTCKAYGFFINLLLTESIAVFL